MASEAFRINVTDLQGMLDAINEARRQERERCAALCAEEVREAKERLAALRKDGQQDSAAFNQEVGWLDAANHLREAIEAGE